MGLILATLVVSAGTDELSTPSWYNSSANDEISTSIEDLPTADSATVSGPTWTSDAFTLPSDPPSTGAEAQKVSTPGPYSSSEASTTEQHASSGHLVSLVSGRLAMKLYQAIIKLIPGRNVVFSPIAITSMLAISLTGSGGQTRQQLLSLLQLDSADVAELKYGFKKLLYSLQHPHNNSTFTLANALFFSDGYEFKPEFVDDIVRYYSALVNKMNFVDNPEESRRTINDLVANRTEFKILELLPPGSVNALTLLMMTTAIYFHAEWMYPFDAKNTELKPFNLAANHYADMVMMTNKKRYRYYAHQKFKILEIPYSSGTYSCYVLRPDTISGISDMESVISVDLLNNVIDNLMYHRPVTLTLPSFHISQDISLRSVLGSMGVEELFSPALSDLSGASTGAELFISELAHAVKLHFNEKGTEGVAGIGQIMAMAVDKRIDFNVNRPFMFLIRHKATKTILFIGRIVRPPAGTKTSIGKYEARLQSASIAWTIQQSTYTWHTLYTSTLCMFLVNHVLFDIR